MKLLKFVGGIFSFILSIVFFVFLIGFSVILFAKNTIAEKKINSYVERMDIFCIPAHDFFEDTYNKDEILKDAISHKLEKSSIPQGLTIKILEKKDLTNFISHNLKQYIDYVLFDNSKPVISRDEILSIVNINMIEEHSQRTLTSKETADFNKLIDDTVTTINSNLSNKKDIMIDTDTKNIINFVYSKNFITYCLLFIAIIFLLISLFRWSLYKPFIWFSIPIIIWSVILIIVSLLQKLFIKHFITTTGGIETLAIKGIDLIFKDILKMGLICLGIGILLLILYNIFKKVFYKEEQFNFDFDNIPKKPSIEEKKLI